MIKIKKIFIANRGEIAVRIIKTAKKLRIKTVVAFANDDKASIFVKQSDYAIPFHSQELKDTYLSIDKIIEIAKNTNCDAIHPGYGFLAENVKFAEACKKAKIIFIGPHAEAIHLMGNKIESRNFVKKLNVPLIESHVGQVSELKKLAPKLDYPILIKAAAGGGGKGMRIVKKPKDFESALESTSREAKNYFGDETVYVEKYLESPRHIEVQILGDNHGNVRHLFERECSLQRRHQKIIEEAPSPTLNKDLRKKLTKDAIKIAEAIKYNNAGTIEFIFDENLNYYFLEMNTRIQVEHPVTELITGIDIVEKQIHIAENKPLAFSQDEIKMNGHAIEARIYAENPENNFLPSPGKLHLYIEPDLQNIRIDSGIQVGDNITGNYDPMISKIISWNSTRNNAVSQLVTALNEYHIGGPETNLAYLSELLLNKDFVNNKVNTTYCDSSLQNYQKHLIKKRQKLDLKEYAIAYILHNINGNITKNNIWEQIGFWRLCPKIPVRINDKEIVIKIEKKIEPVYVFEIEDHKYNCTLNNITEDHISFALNHREYNFSLGEINDASAYISNSIFSFKVERLDILNPDIKYEEKKHNSEENSNTILAPMHGKIVKINIKKSDTIKEGDTVLILESMKMENSILSPKNGKILKINVKEGEQVEPNKILIEFDNE
jgi:3-methylcrotonyl-CoA carboxylase alpha subunit